jgi:hypothetical protein
MKADYSRDSFDPAKQFTRVLMQQGRVQLDADWNEQTSILLHYLQTLAKDLIGDHGTPAAEGQGFMIMVEQTSNPPKIVNLAIGVGHYYVDGILCEMDQPPSYFHQPGYPLDPAKDSDKLPDPPFLVYLDVWERLITAIEDPHIQEVALGGPDTAARTKIVWQVKVKSWSDLKIPFEPAKLKCENQVQVREVMSHLFNDQPNPFSWGVNLAAQAQEQEDENETNACIVSPEARYRGLENQLYRVEIHRGGKAGADGATFKWSRENGSVVFPIRSLTETLVSLEHLGRDERFGLEVGDWVEVVDDATVLRAEAFPLLKVMKVDPVELTVTLSGAPPEDVGRDLNKHPLVRRWDQQQGDKTRGGLQIANDGAALVVESDTDWLNLEDGIQIRFPPLTGTYFTGNYWLVPARTATGDIQWPKKNNVPRELEPLGIQHHYAPLAIVQIADAKGAFPITDLRHFFGPAATCCPDIAVSNPATAKPGEAIPFTARVANVSSPQTPDLKYKWKIAQGGTITEMDGAVISVTAGASGDVVATLTVEGLTTGCPQTAQGTCFILTQPS